MLDVASTIEQTCLMSFGGRSNQTYLWCDTTRACDRRVFNS